MKHKQLSIVVALLASAQVILAQGTAFTYQGLLTSSNSPANGLYDMTFALYNASSDGSQVGSTITDTAVGVTNGLFTVLLDFGSVFGGTTYWLQIGVRTNGGGAFTALSPRQELTPTPYAITAENLDGMLSASQLTGTLPSGLLSGTYSGAVTLNNAGNSFSGSGSGLTGLNASALTSGTVPNARLNADVALLDVSQTFTGTNTFLRNSGIATLVVSAPPTSVPVSTNLFTGLGFQYNPSSGEGALLSSFNDGYAFLSFYTKAGYGYPITKQMIIGQYGNVAIDQNSANNGVLNNGTLAGAGLTFGVDSGSGIASKRTAGGNQYGLDFYTSFTNRMSIAQNGNVGIGTTSPQSALHVVGAVEISDGSGTGYHTDETIGPGGYVSGEEHSINFDDGAGHIGSLIVGWNGADGYFSVGNLYTAGTHGSGTKSFTVFGNGKVGIGTTNPAVVLDIYGTQNIGTYSDGIVNIGNSAGYHVTLDNNEIHGRYNTNTSDLFINDFGGTVYIADRAITALSAGNVGIGTSSPGAKLDVRGDVKLGSSGQYYAAGGATNLLIVRGIVEPDGTIYNGTGFTVTHSATGTYTLTFSTAFADVPALVLTGYGSSSPIVVTCMSGTASGYTVYTWSGSSKADAWWNFVAIGGR